MKKQKAAHNIVERLRAFSVPLIQSAAYEIEQLRAENAQQAETIKVMREALEGALGLIDIICARDDVSPRICKAIMDNLRIGDIKAALARTP